MEMGVPYEGRFVRKQGRSPPLWSFARNGCILAVCTPLSITPVPAAAADDYGGSPLARRGLGGGGHGFGVGGGAAVGLGMLELGLALQGLNANNPSRIRGPPPCRGHPVVVGPRGHPPVEQAARAKRLPFRA
jgi:hypothetical protein